MIFRSRSITLPPSGGGALDGAVYSYTSSSSNTNSNPYWFGGGLGGPIDSGTNGTDFSDASWSLSGNYPPQWDNTHTLSRSLSLGFDSLYHYAVNPSNPASFGIGLDTGGSPAEVYMFGNYYEIFRDSGVTNLQHKFWRIMPTNSISDASVGVYTSHWIGSTSFYESFGNNVGIPGEGGSTVNFFQNAGAGSPDDYPAFNTGIWHTFELWVKPATTTNGTDGAFSLKIRRLSDGVVVTNNAFSGLRDYPDATRLRYVEMQNFFGNSNGVGQHGDCGGGAAWWDDPLVCWGTNAKKQIYIGNASTYSSCTIFAIQPWSVWSGTARTIRLNKGPFAAVSGLWLYETDNAGAPVNSTGIAIP